MADRHCLRSESYHSRRRRLLLQARSRELEGRRLLASTTELSHAVELLGHCCVGFLEEGLAVSLVVFWPYHLLGRLLLCGSGVVPIHLDDLECGGHARDGYPPGLCDSTAGFHEPRS